MLSRDREQSMHQSSSEAGVQTPGSLCRQMPQLSGQQRPLSTSFPQMAAFWTARWVTKPAPAATHCRLPFRLDKLTDKVLPAALSMVLVVMPVTGMQSACLLEGMSCPRLSGQVRSRGQQLLMQLPGTGCQV